MTTFTYTVTVEVEDDLGMATEYYGEDYLDRCYVEYDEAGNVNLALMYPDDKANLIMEQLLELPDNGLRASIGDYSIEYKMVESS